MPFERADLVTHLGAVVVSKRDTSPAAGNEVRRPQTLQFRAVNGWRGPGALAIAVGHFSVAADFISYRRLQSVPLLVDLFFVLSGLVIAQAYSEKLSRPVAIPGYILRRLGRVWPLQVATLAVLVAYEVAKLAAQTFFGAHFSSPAFSAHGYNLVEAIPTNLLLIHSLGIHPRETWDFPSWSLSVEFATYVVFAAFCLVKPAPRRILIVATIAASIAVLVVVAPYHMRSTFDYGVFRCLAGFFAGTLCHDAAKRWHPPAWPMPTLIESVALASMVVWMVFATGTVLVFATPFVICLFIMGFASERGMLSRVLLTKPVQLLAELSFAIYMVHAIVLIFLLAGLHEAEHLFGLHLFFEVPNPLAGLPNAAPSVEVFRTSSAAFEWTIAIAYFTSVLATAYLAYRLVEVPGRAFFGRLAKRVSFQPRAVAIVPGLAEPAEPVP